MPDRLTFRAFAERSSDLIYRYRLHPERAFEYVNRAAERILGYTPAEHYADPDLGRKLVHPDDLPILQGMLDSGPPAAPVVIRWRRKDGSIVWIEQQNAAVYDGDGELVAIEGIGRVVADPTRGAGATLRIVGPMRIDLVERTVLVSGRPVPLTPTEFRLLDLLTRSPGRVVSRATMNRHLARSRHGGGRTCEVHVWALRQKLEEDPRFPEHIRTVRGRGYAYVA